MEPSVWAAFFAQNMEEAMTATGLTARSDRQLLLEKLRFWKSTENGNNLLFFVLNEYKCFFHCLFCQII